MNNKGYHELFLTLEELYKARHFKEFIELQIQAVNIGKELREYHKVINLYRMLCSSFFQLGNLLNALEYLNIYRDLVMEVGNEIEKAAYYNMESIYWATLGMTDKSIHQLKMAISIVEKYPKEEILPTLYNNITEDYLALKQYGQAKNYIDKAIYLLETEHDFKTSPVQTIMQHIRLNLARIKTYVGNTDEAYKIFNELLSEQTNNKSNRFYIEILKYYGEHFEQIGQDGKAYEIYCEALELTAYVEDDDLQQGIFKSLCPLLKRLGRKDDLIEAQSRYIDILNSVQKSNSIEMMYKTELENQKKDIISYHSRDPLTKLFNREYFEKKVTEYIEQKRSFVFVLIDLDHFKQINDQHGHLVGDLALKHVANIFEKYDSVQFISGRFGGDEFICIYEVESVGQMKQDIQLLNDFLQIQFLVVDDQEINLSLSLGATYYAGKDESYADLFAMADAALYKSKKDGRGRANIFEKAYQ